jgi:hypothetical protein
MYASQTIELPIDFLATVQPPAQAKAAIYAPPKYYSPNTIQRDTVFIYYQGVAQPTGHSISNI